MYLDKSLQAYRMEIYLICII